MLRLLFSKCTVNCRKKCVWFNRSLVVPNMESKIKSLFLLVCIQFVCNCLLELGKKLEIKSGSLRVSVELTSKFVNLIDALYCCKLNFFFFFCWLLLTFVVDVSSFGFAGIWMNRKTTYQSMLTRFFSFLLLFSLHFIFSAYFCTAKRLNSVKMIEQLTSPPVGTSFVWGTLVLYIVFTLVEKVTYSSSCDSISVRLWSDQCGMIQRPLINDA